jgi:amidase
MTSLARMNSSYRSRLTFNLMAIVGTLSVHTPAGAASFRVEETTIAQVHSAYIARETTAVAITQAHLDRIAAYDKRGPIINSIVTVNPRALQDAAALDVEFARTGKFVGPLHGIPIIVKDNLDVAGLPMTSGFQGWKDFVPAADAPVVQKIRAAGGIILAKSSLSEFAVGGIDNINSVVPGFTRNPYNTAYATGGSSGGTGASIAASFGIVGVGTDTGGSVRMPSAHTALAGIRPTVGLVSRTGMVPLNSVRDTAGPMARTVADMTAFLDVLAGAEPVDTVTARSAGHIPSTYTSALRADALRGARLGVLRHVMKPDATDARVLALFERALAELRAAGAVVVDPFVIEGFEATPRPPQTPARFKDDITKFIAAHPGIPFPSAAEIAKSGKLHPLHQAWMERSVAAAPVAEDSATIEGLANEQRYRELFAAAMDAQKIDAVIFPVWAQLPVLNGNRNTTPGGSLTFVASALQWPALSVPMGWLEDDLPAGLQILGRAWDESRIIGYAYAYEQTTHHRRSPSATPPLKDRTSAPNLAVSTLP